MPLPEQCLHYSQAHPPCRIFFQFLLQRARQIFHRSHRIQWHRLYHHDRLYFSVPRQEPLFYARRERQLHRCLQTLPLSPCRCLYSRRLSRPLVFHSLPCLFESIYKKGEEDTLPASSKCYCEILRRNLVRMGGIFFRYAVCPICCSGRFDRLKHR